MIQVYTGDGKGKTTAAFGLAMRAAGQGMKVRIIQFMKGSTYTGELSAAEQLGIEVFQFGRTCPHAAVIKSGFMNCLQCKQCWIGLKEATELDRMKIRMAWDLSLTSVQGKNHHILILDEIMGAIRRELVTLNELLNFMDQYPDDMELVLTGRGAHPEVLKRASLVSEMKMIKHPYQEGIASRRGIEY